MKTLYPEGSDPNGGVPSDLYYADLTGNWDLDGDKRYGEWGSWSNPNGDFGIGGVDLYWELMVGRIPNYPEIDTIDMLDGILEKTIRYETLTADNPEWRKNSLLAMSWEDAHGCDLGQAIVQEILDPAGWSYHRVYRPECECQNIAETIPCTRDTVTDVWSSGQFGLAVWFGHGTTVISPSHARRLNDNYPSFTFQVGCSEADLWDLKNLDVAYALLKNGGICTIGATAGAGAYVEGPFSCRTDASSMAYEYTRRIVTGRTSGDSLFDIKQSLYPTVGWGWKQFVIFNIFGDPSISLVKPDQARTIYVDSRAGGDNNGSSWEDAYSQLQNAFAASKQDFEIRVAKGTYKPVDSNGYVTVDRTSSFQLRDAVIVKGGYAGWGEPDPNTRDVLRFETILSGDIGIPDFSADNTYHVVTASNVGSATVLDGFTITDGYADGNDVNGFGGGVYVDQSNPKIINCTIIDNYAIYGGGLYNGRWSNPTLSGCRFIDNSAGQGGGICISYGTSTVTNCTFESNSAQNGPAILNFSSDSVFSNCLFSGNNGTWGGAMNNQWSNPILKNCTFCQNVAYSGGALWNYESDSLLINCILWDDTPDDISHYDADSITEVAYSNISTSDWVPWPGEGNICVNPEFADQNNIDPNKSDYHLKSEFGRWDPDERRWTNDDVTSPCIDKGDPHYPVGNEPAPNGGIINMGAYGGTSEASKSTAN